MRTPGRRRMIAGGVASIAVAGAIGGTVLASHGSAATSANAAVPALSNPSPSSSPATAGAGKAGHAHAAGATPLVARVETATTTSITVVDGAGTAHTLTVGPKLMVSGPHGPEAVTALPQGEIVLIVAKGAHRHSTASTPSPAPSSPGGAAITVATSVKDTGFRAA